MTTKTEELSLQQIEELEQQLLDIETIMETPENIDPAVEFISLLDENIQTMLPQITSDIDADYVKRLQACAYKLSELAEKAQQQLDGIKTEILKIKKNQKASSAYKTNK